MKPTISIIIPVYNHAHTLERSLRSLEGQTYQPIEVIVVDDGSMDDFDAVIGVLVEKIKIEIKIVRQENKGAAAARNRGFAESRGEYVIFWDADTVAEPHMLEKLLGALESHPEAAYAYSRFKFGWKTIQAREFDAEALRRVNYVDTTSLIRREAFPGFDELLKRFQDWDLWLTLLERGQKGVFVPEVLFKKVTVARKGISSWLPSFAYRLPWKSQKVRGYEKAKQIVMEKHGLN